MHYCNTFARCEFLGSIFLGFDNGKVYQLSLILNAEVTLLAV